VDVLRYMQQHKLKTPVIGISAIADQPLRASITTRYKQIRQILKKPVGLDDLLQIIGKLTGAPTNG
jgi:hypothetical protein